ncbi:MAG: efflux RND transporter periplasmic adaptor subunit, partial [Sphingobacteriales bacterium]
GRLFKQGFIAEIEYERSKADARAQRENLAAQQALISIAQKAVNDAVVSAPMSGTISKRLVESGQTISPGQTVFELVDASTLELQGSVPDNQAGIQVGQNIQFQSAGQTTPVFDARITRINPVADAASRALQFYADVNSPTAGLNIGNYVEGFIRLNNAQSGLVLPTRAIQRDNSQPQSSQNSQNTQNSYVWAIRQNKLTRVNVDVVMQDRASNSVMVQGINADDRISLVKFAEQAAGSAVKVN